MIARFTELQHKLSQEQIRADLLRKQLETVKAESERNRIKLERFDNDIEAAIAKRYKTEQAQQQEETIALSKTIRQLKQERETLQEQIRSTENQIQSAEAETKAAQYAAHQAETLLDQHVQKLVNPKMLIANLELGIQVLDCAITQAARHERLPDEDQEAVRLKLETMTDRLGLLKKTVRTHRAEIIEFGTRRAPADPGSLLRQTS